MNRRLLSPLAAAGLAAAASMPASAKIELPSILGSGMVLQRDEPVALWGHAKPGATVTADFAGQHKSATVDGDGNFMLHLDAMEASAQGRTLTLADPDGQVTLDDVLVGEVWICAGQSNMSFPVRETNTAEAALAAAGNPLLRLFNEKQTSASTPQFTSEGTWQKDSAESAKDFAAVGYFFGRDLQAAQGVPVGLIHCSWGGTGASVWMPRKVLESNPDFKPILDRWDNIEGRFSKIKADFEADLPKAQQRYEEELAVAKANNLMEPHPPKLRMEPGSRYTPVGGWNAMIVPIAPFTVRGVTWYQGEANAGRSYQYRELFPSLIQSWRDLWGTPLPFVYVQLPGLARHPEPSWSGWAELREAQAMTLRVPNTAMAVIIDLGERTNLHPTNKEPVGKRVFLAASSLVYGLDPTKGLPPVLNRARIHDNTATLTFDPCGIPLKSTDGQDLRGFVYAGSDKQWHEAQARITGDGEVTVTAPKGAHITSVRYDWADWPDGNLSSQAGLPASPFRTDDWPGVTWDNR